MKKGYEVQKKSVVSNLDQYLDDKAANQNLISLILNSIDTWDNEFQILFSQSLGRCAQKKLIDADNLKKAIVLCLDFIDNMDSTDVY